jgi:hypothetical protein
MSHHLRTRLEERNRAQRGESDAAGVGLQPMRIRETFHRKLPDFAMYATSILLACVIGASVAIYLK